MKNPLKSLSQVLAPGVAGVALFQFANSSFAAALPGLEFAAIAISASLLAVAAADYSRNYHALPAPDRARRPKLPRATTPAAAGTFQSRRDDRLAA